MKRSSTLTVKLLASINNLPQRHLLLAFLGEMRKNTRAKAESLVQVAFREVVVAELQLGRRPSVEVCIEES